MNSLAPVAPALLAWYYSNHRILPFRDDPTPYHVWVSEIMLQQTRVTAALPYYQRFIKALPNITALAACEEEKLHKLWEGLGYYSRVRNLQKAARIVVETWGGQLPLNYEELLRLPGIGEYTAGAIASIAYGLPEVAVDGNVLRVFSRLLANDADITQPGTKREFAKAVKAQQPKEAPGDYNQALMELGALICIPGVPLCGQCPLVELCTGAQKGMAGQLPNKPRAKAKKEIPICVLVVRSEGKVLLHQRPGKGLLARLWEPLLWEGEYTKAQAQKKLTALLPDAKIVKEMPKATHVFTHRIWQMYGWQCEAPQPGAMPGKEYVFMAMDEVQSTYTLPSAFKAYLPYVLGEQAKSKQKQKL